MADDTGRWEGRFPPALEAPRDIRLGAERWLRSVGVPQPAVALILVVLSELAGNAIRHARTELTVTAGLHDGVVRIEVLDGDTRPPALLGLDSESTSGRGLHMVAALSRDWGWRTVETDDGVAGKVVWAEVALDQPACSGGG